MRKFMFPLTDSLFFAFLETSTKLFHPPAWSEEGSSTNNVLVRDDRTRQRPAAETPNRITEKQFRPDRYVKIPIFLQDSCHQDRR